jgi:hypothetical protein
MPPGKKAPPQQSSLTELWASKTKKQSNPATSTTATSDGHPRLGPKSDDATGPTISSEERAYRYFLTVRREFAPYAHTNRAERTVFFTAAPSKRKSETVTSLDSA